MIAPRRKQEGTGATFVFVVPCVWCFLVSCLGGLRGLRADVTVPFGAGVVSRVTLPRFAKAA